MNTIIITMYRQHDSFSPEDNQEMFVADDGESVIISGDDWRGMGAPETVTVTVSA